MKAHLKGSHYVAAIIAGIVGNIFFSAGWGLMGATLIFGLLTAIFGASIGALIGQFGDPAAIADFFSSAGGIANGLTIGFAIGALVLIALGVLFSGLILKGGRVRKPWATTWMSVLISALLSVPLSFVWVAIANASDRLPVGLIVVLGTAVVGILIWLWMTWAHRGYASEFVGASASATATATAKIAPADAPAEVEAAPVAEAPAAKTTAPKTTSAKTTAAKPPAAKKTPPASS
jgi:hypothetical protein